jgi:hypothetical protein
MVMGSLILSAAALFSSESYVFGIFFLAGALTWTMSHSAVVAWINRRRRKKK